MTQNIDEVDFSEFSEELFARYYFSSSRPLIVRNMPLDGKNKDYWTLDYFLSLVKSSDQKVEVAVYEKRENKQEQYVDSFELVQMDVSEALKSASSDPELNGMFYNLLEANIPELIEPIDIPSFLVDKTTNKEGNLWFGNGNLTGMHFDMPNNFYFQIKGEKIFRLYDPSNYFYLYPSGPNSSAIDDIENIDFAKFPLAEKSAHVTIRLKPGDFLYMPPFWWHQVESVGPYISLNYWGSPSINQVLCHPGYYEFIKHFELGMLVEMYELCNKSGFEGYSFDDTLQFIQYKGYHWAAYILGLSNLQKKLIELCTRHNILLDPSIQERTEVMLAKMNKQEFDHNSIMFENLGEDRFFDAIVKIKENDLMNSKAIEQLYKYMSFIKAAKNKDNLTITPDLVNELISFNSQLHFDEKVVEPV